MKKRHQDTLTSRLEECAITQGWCTIRDEELRLWYEQKITKTVWADLDARLKALYEEKYDGAPTFVRRCHDGNNLILYEDELEGLSVV